MQVRAGGYQSPTLPHRSASARLHLPGDISPCPVIVSLLSPFWRSKIVGGGETDSVTFAVTKLGAADSYTYFCSFPGHSAIMKGTLKLVK